MDGLISVVAMVIYLGVALTIGNNKRKQAAKRSGNTRNARFDQAFERIAQAHPENCLAESKQVLQERFSSEGTDPCHEDMLRQERSSMRLQHVSQEHMQEAKEGEDPCHFGQAPILLEHDEVNSPDGHLPLFDSSDRGAFEQDVLRGVVMSEILIRPSQRRGNMRMKRRA